MPRRARDSNPGPLGCEPSVVTTTLRGVVCVCECALAIKEKQRCIHNDVYSLPLPPLLRRPPSPPPRPLIKPLALDFHIKRNDVKRDRLTETKRERECGGRDGSLARTCHNTLIMTSFCNTAGKSYQNVFLQCRERNTEVGMNEAGESEREKRESGSFIGLFQGFFFPRT